MIATFGIPTIGRVMIDNALAYRRGHAWHQALTEFPPALVERWLPTCGRAIGDASRTVRSS